jgi:prophage regulatory protein
MDYGDCVDESSLSHGPIISKGDIIMSNLPEIGFVRLPQILGDKKADIPAIIPLSKSSWRQCIKDGRFPRPVKLGPRTTVWRVEDIRAIIDRP